jgi:hypothetical protein
VGWPAEDLKTTALALEVPAELPLAIDLAASNFVTPCQVFIIPQEHPNQSHESCEPVPPGCPMF